jgi:membrane-bound ClpP family serine protease
LQRCARQGVHIQEVRMLVLGIILMLIGFFLSVPVLWTIGIILAVVGAVLWVAEGTGAAWGRRWY